MFNKARDLFAIIGLFVTVLAIAGSLGIGEFRLLYGDKTMVLKECTKTLVK